MLFRVKSFGYTAFDPVCDCTFKLLNFNLLFFKKPETRSDHFAGIFKSSGRDLVIDEIFKMIT